MVSRIPSVEELISKASELFRERFSADPTVISSAPGRVNIIGEHTDYNDGFVLPMALPLYTVVAGKLNNTPKINIVSSVSEDKVQFDAPHPTNPLKPGEPQWCNYIKGVIANFPSVVHGFDAVIVSSVPLGGGVSSSAALEVATFTFLEAITNHYVDPKEKALACQKAEHQFAGTPCGIMDQFVSTMGEVDHALLIDCRSLDAKLIPLISDNIVVLITNSNVKHNLTGSEYPQRREQCQMAASLLGKTSLRNAEEKDINELVRLGAEPNVTRRAKHVVSEIERTQMAADALLNGDYEKMGQLMYESHVSLRDLFEVSCPELDMLVDTAMGIKGVLGSRMTGGGFGGCTVTLVYKTAVEEVVAAITETYRGKATFYICKPGGGAKIHLSSCIS